MSREVRKMNLKDESAFRFSLHPSAFFLLALLALSCSEMMMHRSSQDYFPLAEGSQWKYLLGNDTTYYEVLGDSSIGGRSCIVLGVDFLPEFWLKEPTEIRKFFFRTISRGGDEYTLEERYGLVYILPFVEGNYWQETFTDTVEILGTDTVFYRHKLGARIAGIENITTPAGSFRNCYRIEFADSIQEFELVHTAYTEWLAPGVGLVKRVCGTEELELAEYRIGP